MEKLNYFYGSHENDLTKSYLVLLRYSNNAFFTFIDYCKNKLVIAEDEREFYLIDFLEKGWEIETQRGNPQIYTNHLLSVLITDLEIDAKSNHVKPSERNAIYDGIITFGDSLTMIIENKPRSENVWLDQLNPTGQNLAGSTKVYSRPIVLEWKEIIKQLNFLKSIQAISGFEKIMIEDFLSYIDTTFPFLNPFDSFDLCKGDYGLIQRRIKNILIELVKDETLIASHRGWGYCIKTNYPQLERIGLILAADKDDWNLEISLWFGDNQRQSKSFYKSNPSITHLENTQWSKYPKFHFSYMSTNLVYLDSEDVTRYLEYWKKNVDSIYQLNKDSVPRYIEELKDEKIIIFNEAKESEMESKFYNTARQKLNICPGFGIIYEINSKDAERLDKEGKLAGVIREKIAEGLRVIGINGYDLLKHK